MTVPAERYRSIQRAREFLYALLDPKKTPKVPSAVRDEARSVLRHFPGDYYLEQLAKKAPDIIENEK